MKPPIFDKMLVRAADETGAIKPSIDGCIPMYSGTNTNKLEDSKIDASKVRSLEMRSTEIVDHINDSTKHLTAEEKAKITADSQTLATHVGTGTIHVSTADRARWDAKETPEQAQAKADVVQANLDEHVNDYELHLTVDEKTMLKSGIYSKTEIDNKFAQFSTGLDWKEAVQKYSDLEIVYPDAKDGWTANVIEDGVTYRYTIPKDILDLEASGYTEADLNAEFAERYKIVWVASKNYYKKWDGTKWVVSTSVGSWIAISANAIPKADDDKDGLMSKENYTKLFNIEEEANYYVHPNSDDPTAEDKHVSLNLRDNITELYECELNGDPKVTIDAEGIVTYKYKGIFTPAERQKLASIEDDANFYEHPTTHSAEMITETTARRFITTAQLDSLDNMATKTLASKNLDGLMSKEMYSKLYDIDYLANNYIHPDSHPATMIVSDENHRFVTDAEKEKWSNPDVATTTSNGAMSKEDKTKLDNIIAGVDMFVTSGDGTHIVHNFNTLDYAISVTPITFNALKPPSSMVTDIWVEYQLNEVIVHANVTDPESGPQFSYMIMKL